MKLRYRISAMIAFALLAVGFGAPAMAAEASAVPAPTPVFDVLPVGDQVDCFRPRCGGF
ncbi:hypothetical protein [Amycolatopsis anabasis]|uniref:hypothetical protein n=1 Tax=Amycolatopsis anabasis TaxID=1840409 RepID=UPI00131A86EF|nr:hypothetical protein [Amycolatopsis anabasis]